MESTASSNTTPFAAAGGMAADEEEEEEASTRRVAKRVIRALQHPLRLLHRAGAGAEFFVLGATGNVYAVTLSAALACTCPDPAVPCKHVLFVLLRVLGLRLHEPCVWTRTLRPCQVARLVGTPTTTCPPGVLAGARARERFHELWSARAPADDRQEEASSSSRMPPLDGAACPVCLEEMAAPAPAPPSSQGQGSGTAAPAFSTCRTCRNAVHAECFARWKRSRSRRRAATTCVVCRSRWRQPPNPEQEREKYMNLAAYMDDGDGDGDVTMHADGGLCAG